MKKTIITFGFIGVFALYSLYQYFGMTSSVAYVAPTVVTQPVASGKKIIATTPTQSPIKNKPVPSPTPIPVPPVVKKGLYTDGTYTGSVADAYYGNIQVQVTISNGKITDVTFLQAPSDRSTSRRINSQADPILSAEAISVQSANVDFVSGASDTSRAFQESLKSALTRAQNS